MNLNPYFYPLIVGSLMASGLNLLIGPALILIVASLGFCLAATALLGVDIARDVRKHRKSRL